MSPSSSTPQIFIRWLRSIESDAEFTWTGDNYINSSSGARYVAKLGDSSQREQFVGEAESLKALQLSAPGLVPRLIASGFVDERGEESPDGNPYFLSEYKKLGSLTKESAAKLGKRLATEVHGYKGTYGFGFAVPTFCGATRLENGWKSSWQECYDDLIRGLLSQLSKQGRFAALCAKGEQVRKRVIPALLGPLKIQPVLLHGDLWSGNTGTDKATGEPIVFDPSSMFGHNEFELSCRMFGGLPPSFLTEYHKHLPKTYPEDQYELRRELYELFHYLNHTCLFGGSYSYGAEKKMDILLGKL